MQLGKGFGTPVGCVMDPCCPEFSERFDPVFPWICKYLSNGLLWSGLSEEYERCQEMGLPYHLPGGGDMSVTLCKNSISGPRGFKWLYFAKDGEFYTNSHFSVDTM